MTNTTFVLATANLDKAREIEAMLEGFELRPRPLSIPDITEDADTLEGNALLKAQALVDATGFAAIADDTGLEVDAIDGAPGVYSSRFAGEKATYADNVDKLLFAMTDVPEEKRTARFRTVAIAVFPNGHQVVAEGVVEGTIARTPVGKAGFGYDPVFCPDGMNGRTFAEITAHEKNAISHRGIAFARLREKLIAES